MASQVAKQATRQPWYMATLQKMSSIYVNLAGYRKMGLKTDDLISEEDEQVLQALKRLPPQEQYDRVYRIRRATQLSLQHKILPKNEWIKDEEDLPYLSPILAQIKAEAKERAALDTMEPVKKH
ncbi:cytochrome b-c1 complex subunit 7 [Podospora conica]|nr:cytochrome b-c1 complex subunit 7 [Schizothecium conicum]